MSASSPLPPKLYFRIGEVAGLVGVEPHVLRYWEREFRSIRPTKSAKGQRVYSRRDVENLMRVRELLYAEGFTIAGAKKKLQRGGSEPSPPSAQDGALDAADPGWRTPSDAAPAVDGRAMPSVSPVGPVSSMSSMPAMPAASAVSSIVRAAGGATVPPGDVRMRDTLTALRREVEAFLAELGG